jgi:choline-sulfatase
MTGVYPSECDSFCNATVWDGSHPTWGARLRDAGYDCRATGKMDLNDDFDTGFAEFKTSHNHRRAPAVPSFFRQPLCYIMGERPGVNGSVRHEAHPDASRAQTALDFILNESGALTTPWAYYVGFVLPHPPFSALGKYYHMYPKDQMDLPNIPAGYLENQHLAYQALRHYKRISTPIPAARTRRARAAYYAMLSELDDYIGRLWDALEQTGQLKNTIFVYTSDHGETLGEHGLWYKSNLYDYAARVPLIIAGGGLPQGRVVSHPVGHVDFVYTLLELAGAQRDTSLRGISLLPLIHRKPGTRPEFAYSESHCAGNCTGSFMIRKGDWKYIQFCYYDAMLFNLAQDPGELRNRIDDPTVSDVRDELKNTLYGLVDPEEITMRAFQKQKDMLRNMAAQLTEDELYTKFEKTLGAGQARMLAMQCKRANLQQGWG